MNVLTTSKGRSVETNLNDSEALAVLRENKDKLSGFGSDLVLKARKYTLSHDQIVWVHILAKEIVDGGAKAPEHVSGFGSILTLLRAAREAGLKWPKVRLQTGEGKKVVLALAGGRSKRPGTVNVTDGKPYGENVWYGRVNSDGNLEPSLNITDDVRETLQDFADDPAGVARVQGALTDSCAFCGRALDTQESVGAGYGPVCAKKYGLPWGAATAEVYESKKNAAVDAAEIVVRDGFSRPIEESDDSDIDELMDAVSI